MAVLRACDSAIIPCPGARVNLAVSASGYAAALFSRGPGRAKQRSCLYPTSGRGFPRCSTRAVNKSPLPSGVLGLAPIYGSAVWPSNPSPSSGELISTRSSSKCSQRVLSPSSKTSMTKVCGSFQ